MELIGWIGTGVVAVVAAGIIGVWIYLKRKWKPTYTTIQGCKVYCQECSHMKTRKADVEEELDRVVKLLVGKFEKGRMVEELRRLSINFKKSPFKTSSGEMASGMCDSGKRFVAVYAREFGDMRSTSLSHEVIHYFLETIEKKFDCSHSLKEYWRLINDGN